MEEEDEGETRERGGEINSTYRDSSEGQVIQTVSDHDSELPVPLAGVEWIKHVDRGGV